jgi:hypothetical protein
MQPARMARAAGSRNHREGWSMVPDIAGKGHSFTGAMRYYLHDKRQPGDAAHPTTSERVAWTEIRNLPVDDPHFATRLMIATATQADELKRQAGIKATGRRSTKAVYAFSLSWHPDEAGNLDKAEMVRAADEALAALDASHLQCVIVCHRDQSHPHVHCIVNRVDPNDGRMAVLSKDRDRLSKWAHGYERERGPLLTPKRAERYGPEAERQRNQQERVQDMAAKQRERSPRAILAELDAAQRERHSQEWQALGESYRTEHKAILERHPSPKAIIAEHRKERRVTEKALRERQAGEMAEFNARSRSLFGRLKNALSHAREVRPPEQGRFGFMKAAVRFAFSPAVIRQHIADKHKVRRETLSREGKAQLAEKIAGMKQARQLEFTGLSQRFEKNREALIARQDGEKAKMKEAWRRAPKPERGKGQKSRAKDGADQGRDPGKQERTRTLRPRNRGRSR